MTQKEFDKRSKKFTELLILSHFPDRDGKYPEEGKEIKDTNQIAQYLIEGWNYDIKEMFIANKGKCLVKRVYWKRRIKK